MKKIKFLLLLLFTITISGCKEEDNVFPISKRHWTPEDYRTVVLELKYNVKPDKDLPSFSNPETRIIIEKLVDHQNYEIVLDDNELGLKHKSSVAQSFFNQWKEMNSLYRELDRKDMYVYGKEMVSIYQFGLGLQLKYFKLGNDKIIEGADDPNSKQTKNYINSNNKTIISNFLNYLDEINDENSHTSENKKLLSQGIDTYFFKLIEQYPESNYDSMKRKAELLEKKTQSTDIKNSLNKLILFIDSKNKP